MARDMFELKNTELNRVSSVHPAATGRVLAGVTFMLT